MSNFTQPLIVKKLPSGLWQLNRSFQFYIGNKKNGEVVLVPQGFKTDFASVPRIFWSILPPDGKYSQAAVLHDYLYCKKVFSRKKCDDIFLEAMQVLKVPVWKRIVMHKALRMFGWISWNSNTKGGKDD